MNSLQSQMYSVFSKMLNAALHYRATGEKGGLQPEYGICDNIPHYADEARVDRRKAIYTKESLIRKTPNYSGSYHYPVPSGDGVVPPDEAFNNARDKWMGVYGGERILQLQSLIEAIQTDWKDSYAEDSTPASKIGLYVGDIVIHNTTGELWKLETDDDSTTPYFRKVDGEDSNYININNVTKFVPEQFKGGFFAMLRLFDRNDAKIAKIDAEIAKHNDAIQTLMKKRGMLSFESANVEVEMLRRFKVRRAK